MYRWFAVGSAVFMAGIRVSERNGRLRGLSTNAASGTMAIARARCFDSGMTHIREFSVFLSEGRLKLMGFLTLG